MLKKQSSHSSLIILGQTGAGKSTLSNLLSGKSLEVNTQGKRKVISCTDKDSFAIGHQIGKSKTRTSIPQLLTDNNCYIFDTPGFQDTEGDQQRLVNSLYLFETLRSSKSIKLALVVPYASIENERGNSLMSFLAQIQDLFNGLQDIRESVIIVVTKVDENLTAEDIHQDLIDISSGKCEQVVRFIKNICQKDRVCLFEKPQQPSNTILDYSQLKTTFFEKINQLEEYAVRVINMPIDNNTKIMIQQELTYENIKEGNQRILQIQGVLIKLSEVQKLINNALTQRQGPSKIRIYAKYAIFCDCDIIGPSLQLVLISPRLILFQNISINLRGIDGNNHPAQQLQQLHERQPGAPGIDGLPGMPGFNGGDLMVACDEIIDADLQQQFQVYINVAGGRGGRGQNGQDGAKGLSGENGDIRDVEERKESCLIERKEFKFTDKDGLQKLEQAAKVIFTFNEQFKETYQSKFTKPINGGNGGAGGKGGVGGLPGTVTLFDLSGKGSECLKKRIHSLCNSQGTPGENGLPGRAGASGCQGQHTSQIYTYQGVYINERVFPVFRNVSEQISQISENTIQPVSSAATAATAGAVVYSTTKEAVQNVTLNMVNTEGKKLAVNVSKNLIHQASRQASGIASEEIGKSVIQYQVNQLGQKVITKTVVETTKESVKQVGLDVALEASKNMALQGSKEASNYAVKSAIVNTSKGFWGTAGGFLASCGFSIAIQGALSIGSAYLSSRWDQIPSKIQIGSSKEGKINYNLNSQNQLGPPHPQGMGHENELQLYISFQNLNSKDIQV
ncbi:hypothetical protein ABPG72_016721 [Tetrahymena utriculariae]